MHVDRHPIILLRGKCVVKTHPRNAPLYINVNREGSAFIRYASIATGNWLDNKRNTGALHNG